MSFVSVFLWKQLMLLWRRQSQRQDVVMAKHKIAKVKDKKMELKHVTLNVDDLQIIWEKNRAKTNQFSLGWML